MMPRRRLLVHVVYAILIVLAFLGGRSSLRDRGASESASAVIERPSILLAGNEAQAVSHTDREPKEVAEVQPKQPLSSDDFATQVAEMLKVGVQDYNAFSDVLKAWVDLDPMGAIEFLARGESRDDMLRWIVSMWGREDSENASRWLAENEHLEGLGHAIEGLTQGIQNDDPESAMEWAKMIEDPSTQTRVLARISHTF
jgi:hypothetical protein